MTGSGFKNVGDGAVHLYHRVEAAIGIGLTEAEKITMAAIRPTFDKVLAVFEAVGPEMAQVLIATMFSAAVGAISGGASAAGQAAIEAGTALLAQDGKTLTQDV